MEKREWKTLGTFVQTLIACLEALKALKLSNLEVFCVLKASNMDDSGAFNHIIS